MVGEKSCWKQGFAKRFYIEASGMRQFISPQLLSYDLLGEAKCSLGPTQRFAGCFEDGRLSGPGVENIVDCAWRVGFRGTVFRGTWTMSRPCTGTCFDQRNCVLEGIVTSVGGGAVNEASAEPREADRMPLASAHRRPCQWLLPVLLYQMHTRLAAAAAFRGISDHSATARRMSWVSDPRWSRAVVWCSSLRIICKLTSISANATH